MDKKITAVVFDLDGTLLDTLQDLSDSVNHALRTHGLPSRSTAEVRKMLGNGIRFLMEHAVPSDLPAERFEPVFDTFRSYYVDHCLDKTRPYEGILPMLDSLRRHGLRMAIVSNKLDAAVQELNERFFAQYVDSAVGESETVRRKPNPDGVLEAIRRLGSTPESSVYVGDSEVDFATARNAGVPCITVLWGFRDEDFLRSIGADTFARRPADIIGLLTGE